MSLILHYNIFGGRRVVNHDTIRTISHFSNGCSREIQLVITYDRQGDWRCRGISGIGIVIGTIISDNTLIKYKRTIEILFGYDLNLGYFKTEYKEHQSMDDSIPKEVPFEHMFIEDALLRYNY
jgi:hypothetical protein